ncbi:hypothetical protein NDU88_006150 [Pleurodeles waltl]|uniref:Uncharacterized protein n=1 Tax=Pleurodeles waltl TaxID=8319 RepID=A0AAV7VQK5_PLEWA|nr:hypothetical protein NDU88_006150 [Pleurodeles waltl]
MEERRQEKESSETVDKESRFNPVQSTPGARRKETQDPATFSGERGLGRQSRTLLEMMAEQCEESEDDLKDILTYTKDLKENLHIIWEEAHKALREAQEKQKAYYDAHSSPRSLTVGHKVLVLLPSTENKLLAGGRNHTRS